MIKDYDSSVFDAVRPLGSDACPAIKIFFLSSKNVLRVCTEQSKATPALVQIFNRKRNHSETNYRLMRKLYLIWKKKPNKISVVNKISHGLKRVAALPNLRGLYVFTQDALATVLRIFTCSEPKILSLQSPNAKWKKVELEQKNIL